MREAFDVRLLTRDLLAQERIGGRRLAALVAGNELIRIRPGVYVWNSEWARLTPEGHVVLAARALDLVSERRPCFSHSTAAALLGLPLYGATGSRPHVVLPDDRPQTGRDVVRHRGGVGPEETVNVRGLACTGLARTVADVGRTTAFETAVCVADAALHTVARGGPGSHDDGRDGAFREDALTITGRFAHGRARARRVLAFADGRADGPGESVSRIRLATLGFAAPRLQVKVPAANGRSYYVDFALDDVDAFGEFDGRGKYRDPTLRGTRSVEDVLEEEKRREDWIRGTTDRRLVRWGWSDIRTPAALANRLAAFGIRSPERASSGRGSRFGAR